MTSTAARPRSSADAPGNGSGARDFRVAIIGSGFGGLGMATRLTKAGIDDFVVLEKADDIGGTWRENTYPGCRCDVPSHLYSYSFALNPEWSSTFSPQPEIWDYMKRVAHEHGVMPHVRLGHQVQNAAWDEEAGHSFRALACRFAPFDARFSRLLQRFYSYLVEKVG